MWDERGLGCDTHGLSRWEGRVTGEMASLPEPGQLQQQVTVTMATAPDAAPVISMKLVIPLHFIYEKKTPNNAVTPQRQSQFTPKMKANAVPRLLSSLV